MIYGSNNLQKELAEMPPDLIICGIPQYPEQVCSGALVVIEDVCTLDIVEDVLKKGGKIISVEEAREEARKITLQLSSFEIILEPNDISGNDLSFSEPAPNQRKIEATQAYIPMAPTKHIPQHTSRGEVVSAFSSKGGVGKSTTALNLGVGYALQGKKTILADLDIGDGDAPEKIGMSSYVSPNIENWREYGLDRIKSKHSSGLYILPHGGNRRLLITENDVEDLIISLSSIYDVVVLDYGVRPFHQHTSRGMELSDQVYVVTDLDQDWIPEFAAHFNADYGDWITSGKARLIVNKVAAGKYYKPADVAKIMGFTAWYEIPERPVEFLAASRGNKAVIQLPKSEAGIQYAQILGEVPAAPKSIWKRIFGG